MMRGQFHDAFLGVSFSIFLMGFFVRMGMMEYDEGDKRCDLSARVLGEGPGGIGRSSWLTSL